MVRTGYDWSWLGPVITGPNQQSALSLPHLFLCIITLWNTIVTSHHINFFSTHHQRSTPTRLTPTKCDETQQTMQGAWGRQRQGGSNRHEKEKGYKIHHCFYSFPIILLTFSIPLL